MPFLIYLIIFILGLIIGAVLAYYILKERARTWFREWQTEREDQIRKDVIKRSRAALKGRVGEQLAPVLPVFDYEPSDARFIGSPVDYVVFEGDSKNDPRRIIFADVKTGNRARLTPKQKGFKEVVENGEVEWETIRVEEFEKED